MYGKKSFDKRYLFIVILLIVSLLLVVIAVSLNKERNLSAPEQFVKDSAIFIGNVISAPVKFVKEKLEEAKEKNDIYEKFDINSIYNGINIYDICYLVNKNKVYKICAIFDKNSKTDDFYVEKFVLLDLKTGSISEFK